MLFRFTIHAALSSAVVAATAAVPAKFEGGKNKEHDGGPMTAVSFVAKYDPNADVDVDVDVDVESEDVVQLLRPLFHKESSSALENQQMLTNNLRNSFSLGTKDGPNGNKKDPSAETITAVAAARNPFVPQKLTTVYDPVDNHEEDVVQLLRSTFHEVPPASKNRHMPTKPLRNPSFLPGTKDDPTTGARDDSRPMGFDASAELGILDGARILSEEAIGTRELVDACDGNHPVVSPDVNLRAIIYSCLYETDNCPYNVTLGLDCWNTSQVTDMSDAFAFDAIYFNQPLNSWQTSAVTDMRGMFRFASSFNQQVDSWDTSAVTDMSYMFENAESFNQQVDSWDTSAVTDMRTMFAYAESFNQQVDSWDTSAVTDTRYMFRVATSFNQQVDSWDTSAVTDMFYMFANAESFNQQVDSWDTSAVTDMRSMFRVATSFNQQVDSWETSAVTDMRFMFSDARSFNQQVDSWETSAVTDMSYMFWYAKSFNQQVDSWETSAVTDMRSMFAYAESFNQQVDSWETSAVTDMSYMFDKARSFNQQVDSWDTSAVTDMSFMFFNATSFNQCLSSWAYKNPTTITGHAIFNGTDCPDQGIIPNSIAGPWCQGYDQCYPQHLEPPQSFTTAAIVLGVVAVLGFFGFYRYRASSGRERTVRSAYKMTNITDLGSESFT